MGDEPVFAKGRVLFPITLVASIVIGTWVIRGAVADMDSRIAMQGSDLTELKDAVAVLTRSMSDDRWRRSDMAFWLDAVKQLNPELRLPQVAPMESK